MNGIDRSRRRFMLIAPLALVIDAGLQAQSPQHISASTIPADHLIQPEQFNQELQVNPQKALILQVGSRVLFEEAHIPGAEYAGPASTPAGLDVLRARVTSLPRTQEIVIYCGCCPWNRCPNMGAAWNLLQQMGFTHVRALYIADNFGADWVAKGFRAEASH